ncbi:MAG: TetR/AcrR family transcriptional regulator [Saprospiraceae bacterium]|nr:TetR/AcrR family transcriptional regulator [Saprospiraceae bacterium]
MPKIDHDTKKKILQAAEAVFHRNGFKGTRTIQIAEEAGISRTMLHYYFNTKEALFEEVLNNTLGAIFKHLKNLIGQQPQDFEKIIENLVNVISDLFEEKPGLPGFISNILNTSPELLLFLPAVEQDNLPALLDHLLEEGKKKNAVAEYLTGEDLILSIYALCSIHYIAAPYIRLKENRNEEEMKAFIRKRRPVLLHFVLNGIKPGAGKF